METHSENLCPKCKSWLNRPAQINLIVVYNDKVLILHKNAFQFADKNIKTFYYEYIKKQIPDVEKAGWFDLPGGDVRQEHTLEDSIYERLSAELGIRGSIKGLIGVYDSENRDPRTSGVSFCFSIQAESDSVQYDPNRIDRVEWVDQSWLKDNRMYSDHDQMLSDYFKEIRIGTKYEFEEIEHSPRILGSYDPSNRCLTCGQYRNRPIQVDGVLEKNKKILLLKRLPEGTKKEDELTQWYKYGQLSLPGGYVDRNETTKEALEREFKEETGLDISVKEVIGVYSGVNRDPKSQGVSICYKVGIKNKEEYKNLDQSKFKWVSKDDEITLAYDHNEIVQDYFTS